MLAFSQICFIIFINSVCIQTYRMCEIMQVNELSKLTGINIETIRMYRSQGFLHPIKLKNGYYDYSMQDYTSLLHIKKLRSFNFSLQEINRSEHIDNFNDYAKNFNDAEIELQKEIERIQQKIDFIEFEKKHVLSSANTANNTVSLNQSVDEKIDFYPPFKDSDFLKNLDSQYFYYITTPIFISKEILNGPIEDKIIETKVGIGTYTSIYKKLFSVSQENCVIIPNGLCISQIITVKDLTHINVLDIAPMMKYAKKMKKKFISDTTGYLVGITYQDSQPIYVMRIRACIEENDIISDERIFKK